jgi:hypothetical protein
MSYRTARCEQAKKPQVSGRAHEDFVAKFTKVPMICYFTIIAEVSKRK